MKLFTERCFTTMLLVSVLVCLCASLTIKNKKDELEEGILEAAIERDIQSDAVEKREPRKNNRKNKNRKKINENRRKHLHSYMDLFEVNRIEEEEILHHEIHSEENENDYVAQGDILFTPGEQERTFLTDDDNERYYDAEKSNVQNDALKDPSARWPTTIPYVVSSSLDSNALQAGFDEYEAKTCLRFQRRNNERDYINFIQGSGCYSFVGRRGGAQDVSIGFGCECRSTVVHEIMHALGFYHEQARPDRDNFVRILYENVRPGFQNNFAKVNSDEVTYFDTQYDYNSVMHYKKNEFSTSRFLNTIEALDNPNRVLGKVNCGDGLSELDALELNRMYCSSTVPTLPVFTFPQLTIEPTEPTTTTTTTTTTSTTTTTRAPVIITLPPTLPPIITPEPTDPPRTELPIFTFPQFTTEPTDPPRTNRPRTRRPPPPRYNYNYLIELLLFLLGY